MIRFLDTSGFSWRVAELPERNLADATGCLYFFSGGSTLRLRHYPRNWEALGWQELESLRSGAEVLSADPSRSQASADRGARPSEMTA